MAIVANLSFDLSLASPRLPFLHSSSPGYSFPVSSCASRCSCNDESVAALCRCIWHRDVSLQALTPSPSPSLPHPPTHPKVCLSRHLIVCLSISHSQWWGIAWPPASVMEQTEHTDPPPTTNNKQELSSTICQLIFTGGISEIAHLTFRPNGSGCRKQRC